MGKGRGAGHGRGIQFEPLQRWGAFEEAGYVSIEREGGGEGVQPGICDGARARREHPARVGSSIEGEMERGELGHSRDRVSERAIK